MEIINQILDRALPASFNPGTYFLGLLISVVSVFLVAGIFRLWLGPGSTVNSSISSAVAIISVYGMALVIFSFGGNLQFLFSPLPFISASIDRVNIFPVFSAAWNEICAEFTGLLILLYLMNLLEVWLPKGRNFWSWYGFRFLAMIFAICLHYCLNLLLTNICSVSTLELLPYIILGIVAVILLLAFLKMILKNSIEFLSGFLGLFHTFLFKKSPGKQLLRALVTTLLITGVVCVLNYLSVTGIAIASIALLTYLPFIIIGLLMWYVIDKYL